MHIHFDSSHVARVPGDKVLTVDVAMEDDDLGQTVLDTISFSVPTDYHVHNDLVAAALMTLAGHRYRSASFNFPISQPCADILSDYYRLDDVGPVDASLEPRRRGRNLGLNFSGGTDSTAVWLLLNRIGEPFKLVSSDYGGSFRRERNAFMCFNPDIVCRTDFRRRGYEVNRGRFNSAVPLLFADYLDLYGIATGHNMLQNPLSIERPAHGRPPAFTRLDLAVLAGGLEEVHLFRSVTFHGTMAILLRAAPELLLRCFSASSRPGSWKFFGKAILLRGVAAALGLPRPAFVERLDVPTTTATAGGDFGWAVGAAAYARRYDPELAALLPPEITSVLGEEADTLDDAWMLKYNPALAELVPAAMRDRLVADLRALGFEPYTEHDWEQVEAVRRLTCATASFTDNDILPEMCAD